MYTANIVDTVVFRSLGQSSSPHVKSLKDAAEQAGTELWVPSPIYRELTDYGAEPPVNPYETELSQFLTQSAEKSE
jgi:hypothetical protein